MLVGCPQCKTRYRVEDEKVGAEGIKLRCVKCRTIFRVVKRAGEAPAPTSSLAPAPPAQQQAKSGERIRVVVANESEPFCNAVKKVLSSEPFDVFSYNDGAAAFEGIKGIKPHVVLLDVALPGMYGFELCEALKKEPSTVDVKVVLIASIYDKTRYKRLPNSLYGADDYIEKHHIPDELAAKIYSLVSGQNAAEQSADVPSPSEEEAEATRQELSEQEMAAHEDIRQEIRQDEVSATEAALPASAPAELPEAHVKAKRLARIIASDIALYNQALFEEGVRTSAFYELLANDIQEGSAHYERRVAEEIRNSTSYLKEAFEDIIAKKKRELNI